MIIAYRTDFSLGWLNMMVILSSTNYNFIEISYQLWKKRLVLIKKKKFKIS